MADRCFPLLLVILCLALGCGRLRSGLDMTDEGILAYGAERVTQGQLPNRDFISLQPPLSFYTAAVMYKLLGTSLLSLRILGFALYLAIPLLIFGIARTMMGPLLSLAAALPAAVLGIPFFNFVPFAPWQGATASAAAVFLYLRATRGGSGFCGGLAGLMTAAAMLCRHDQGFYIAVSILAYTLALKLGGTLVPKEKFARVFGGWGIGIAAGLLPWTIYWWREGAIPAMFQQLVLYFFRTYVKTNSVPLPFFNVKYTATQNAAVSLFYLPPVVGLLAALWLWRQYRRQIFGWREANMTLILTWAGLFYCQVLGRSDIYHLLITQIPFFILSACLLAAALDYAPARVPVAVLATALLAGFLAWGRVVFMGDKGPEQDAPLARAGVRFQGAADVAELVKQVQEYAPPERSILCLSYEPLLYFLCERRNPTRWNYLWPGDQSTAEFQTLVAEARRDPPAVVLIGDEAQLAQFAPIVLDYVHADYRKTNEVCGITIYLPKSSNLIPK